MALDKTTWGTPTDWMHMDIKLPPWNKCINPAIFYGSLNPPLILPSCENAWSARGPALDRASDIWTQIVSTRKQARSTNPPSHWSKYFVENSFALISSHYLWTKFQASTVSNVIHRQVESYKSSTCKRQHESIGVSWEASPLHGSGG